MIRRAPVKFRSRPQGQSRPTRSAAPGAALTLVAADFDGDALLTISFDRAVDVSAMDVAAVGVGFSGVGIAYQGAGEPTLVDAVTVQVPMVEVSARGVGGGFELFATAQTGLRAVDDGGTWAGCDGVELPFGV